MQDNEGGQELLSRQEREGAAESREREPSLPAPMQRCWLVTAAYIPNNNDNQEVLVLCKTKMIEVNFFTDGIESYVPVGFCLCCFQICVSCRGDTA